MPISSLFYCHREKYKAEIKDRKVLEILQSKDYTIQELEQVQYSLVKQALTLDLVSVRSQIH